MKGEYNRVQITDQFEVNASLGAVWDVILNPVELLPCIPGAEEMYEVAKDTYKGTIKDRVGPFVVRMKVETKYEEVIPKEQIMIVARGHDTLKAGRFAGECSLSLTELPGNTVRLSYSMDVKLVGRLATFGQRIIMAKVKSSAKKFSQNINKKFSNKKSALQ